jgi:Putative addiction module component
MTGHPKRGVEEAWAAEIKQRVDNMPSGKAEMIPGQEVLRELAKDFPDEESDASVSHRS